jgi:hypothetical protein
VEGLGCLLIDLQDGFLKAIPGKDEITNRAIFIAKACNLLGIPLYISEQVPEKLGSTTTGIPTDQAFVYGKNSFSAWDNPAFQSRIEADQITHLLVAGIETPICVYQTILAARRDDMAVTLLSDAIGCRRPGDAPSVIRTLQDHGTLHLPSESIFYSILGNTTHPHFRSFTQLVKHHA